MLNKLTSLALLATMTSAGATPTKAILPAAPAPFAAQLDAQLAKHAGNFIYSPASISSALAMTREGANGDTASTMDSVLGLDARKIAKDLVTSFKTPKQQPGYATVPELSIANRLFGDKSTKFEKPFLDVTSKDYQAPVEALDFQNASAAARQHINDWVAKQTHDKIRDLLADPDVTPATKMVLVNAIYMKASWQTEFDAARTKPAPFQIAGGANKKVDTMHMQGPASWGAHGGARTVDLPYTTGGGPRLSMLVMVPEGASLADVEAAYAREGLVPFLTATSNQGEAAVALPKFEVGTSFELQDPLTALGLGIAFSSRADFTGMSKVATQISAVVHKAWAKVDEKGIEAAAATAVVMRDSAAMPVQTPHAFDVDRSFLFFVHDDHGNVLFAGRIMDPSTR
ncbi:MAG: serpin family protein [Kofleriaceae bacterium]